MFGKRRAETPTIIGAGTGVEGTVRCRHGLHVDGRIDGDVFAEGDVSIGPDGSVRGAVHADELAIAGFVEGTVVVSGRLHMLATGRLRGDASYATLQVDAGAVVEGHTEHVADAERGAEDAAKDKANEPSDEAAQPPAAVEAGAS